MRSNNIWQFPGFVVLVLLFFSTNGEAHESGTVELSLNPSINQLTVEMDLLDLDHIVGLRRPGSDRIVGADLRSREPAVRRYITEGLAIRECDLRAENVEFGVRQSASPRAVVTFSTACENNLTELTISSRLFQELPDYRTVLRTTTSGADRLVLLGADETVIALNKDEGFSGFATFLIEGMHHIFLGIDHLVFLLLLILPLSAKGSFRQRFLSVFGLVTAFTIAHSVTLVLSTFGKLSLPPGPVEVVIAASILVVAALNLVGRIEQIAWPIAYSFGLVHGFGFAGAFKDLAVGGGVHWSDLLAFNLGVEAGQLIVVAIALLALGALSRRDAFTRVLVPGGSAVAALLSVFWIVDRL